MREWLKNSPVSCGKIMKWQASVIECQCPKCKKWCLKWATVLDYDFCPNCGADMRNPNCVRCDHFGKCEGCERRSEE